MVEKRRIVNRNIYIIWIMEQVRLVPTLNQKFCENSFFVLSKTFIHMFLLLLFGVKYKFHFTKTFPIFEVHWVGTLFSDVILHQPFEHVIIVPILR